MKKLFEEFVDTDELGVFCSHCNGSLNARISKNQIENFRGSLCNECKALHPKEITGHFFSQEELEAAYKQMEWDRKEDYNRANRALQWVCKEAEIDLKDGKLIVNNHGFSYAFSPYPISISLAFVTQTYGPFVTDFTNKLNNHNWAKTVSGTQEYPVYEVTTPEGVYALIFDYFDNHYAGY